MRTTLLILLIVNLLQAALTTITADEAYYADWSKSLAFGYFDHPPGVAFFIFLGKCLAGNTSLLGIRLFFVLSQTAALWLIFKKIIGSERPIFLAWLAIPSLHVYGWLATPDAILLLAAAVFFRMYQQYLIRPTWLLAVGLGISMSAMLWSKYHGLPVLLFTFFSNPKLVRDPKAWLAVAVGVFCFSPHLYWQWDHGFPTFQYHFNDRSPEPYVFRHSVEFVVNQLLLFHPVLIFLAFKNAFTAKNSDKFEQAMRFNLAGFPLFFLAATVNNYAEPHWTYVIVIPVIYFLSRQNAARPFSKAVVYCALAVAALLLAARIALIFPNKIWPLEMYRVKSIARAIEKAADGYPVVVANSYQVKAATAYYLPQPTAGIAMPGRRSRANQYTAIWDEELAFNGDTVFCVASYPFYGAEKLALPDFPQEEWWGKKTPDFLCLKRLVITGPADNNDLLKPFNISVQNPYPFPVSIQRPARNISAILRQNGWEQSEEVVAIPDTIIAPGATLRLVVPGLHFKPELMNDPTVELVWVYE